MPSTRTAEMRNIPIVVQAVFTGLLIVTTLLIYRFRYAIPLLHQPATEQTPEILTDIVYRIRGVPSDWGEGRLQTSLNEQFEGSSFTVGSLAMEHHGRSKTATVNCRKGTALPQYFSLSSKESEDMRVNMKADKDFHGVTTLCAPPPEEHLVDIVAISGLGGNAYGSFKSKNRSDPHMWLRDSLPSHLLGDESGRPMARVMLYGYDSKVAESKSFANLASLAQNFRESLKATDSTKPLIFVAHSLGGLIVKETIIALENSKFEEHRKLLDSIYGAVFFGVPHQGMDVTSLLSMCNKGPNIELVASLNAMNSHILDLQRRQFPKALQKGGNTEVFCFYETLQSPTACQNEKTGGWEMSGPEKFLVSKSSATYCRPLEDDEEHICGLAKGHSQLVKFDREDNDGDLALQKIRDFTKRAIGGRERLENANVKFIVPYKENPDFVGRESLLAQVKQHFGFGPGLPSRVSDRLALHGLGGIGKTQIVIAFVRWIERMRHQIAVFWVHASNEARFRQGFARIAEEYKIPGREDPKADVAALVRVFLEQKHSHRWIMIIDNADDKELFFPQGTDDTGKRASPGLTRYFPQCDHGSIVMTSRDGKLASNFNHGKAPLEIGELTDNEALWLVHRSLKHQDTAPKEASQLSKRIERLPLALAQALAFITQNEISISQYIQLLDSNDKTLVTMLSEPFETIGRDDEAPNAVTEACIISFKQIEKSYPLAAEFISLISLFDRQAILERFVIGYQKLRREEEASDDLLDTLSRLKSLGTLKAYSFITETTDRSYDMHRLVQLVTRKWLLKEEKLDTFRSQAVSVLCRAYPRVGYGTLNEIMRMLPHTKAILDHDVAEEKETEQTKLERGRILIWTATYFKFKSQFHDAEQLAQQAHHLFDAAFGAEHERTLAAARLLLQIYAQGGTWSAAVKVGEELRLRTEQALGRDHKVTLRITRTLAELYRQHNRLKEAEDLLLVVVETSRKRKGSEHQSTLNSIGGLTGVYFTQGRLDEAEKLQLELVKTVEKVRGNGHPHTLSALNNLAGTYENQERFEEAGDILTQVVETRRKVLGPEHAYTLTAMNNLAVNHAERGNLEQAQELGSRVWRLRQKKFGENNPYTLSSMHNYACFLQSSRRTQEAIDLVRDCWSRRKVVLGPEHPHTLASQRFIHQWGQDIGEQSHASASSPAVHEAKILEQEQSPQNPSASESG